MKNTLVYCLLIVFNTTSCKESNEPIMENPMTNPTQENSMADVISVSVSGDENSYTFSVGIKSPDTGCNQYADWWEVITEEGALVYRRILAHSHVSEQPFTRSGGTVAISKDQIVYVRAHMNTNGYGTKVFKGSVAAGFLSETLEADFADTLANTQPLPTGCAF